MANNQYKRPQQGNPKLATEQMTSIVDKKAKAHLFLESRLSTMAIKTWSVITCSVEKEESYSNTLYKALLSDARLGSFLELQSLLVDCCILASNKKSALGYYSSQELATLCSSSWQEQ
jgi:hypothetical protein